MADYIERKVAVRRFEQLKEQAETMRDKLYLDGVLAVIDALPDANVREDVQGEVTDVFEDDPLCLYGFCSVCGSFIQAWNFCPNCGARMGGNVE